MMLNVTLNRKDNAIETEPCQVEQVWTLTDDEFRFFKNNLLEEYDFLRDNRELMGYSQDGVRHCMLIVSESGDDGILVDAQGSSYARYSAHVPHARQLLEHDQYASLAEFDKQMRSTVDKCVDIALHRQTEGSCYIPRELLPNQYDSPWFQYELLGEMLSERPEIDRVETMSDELFISIAPAFRNAQTDGLRELSQDEVDIMAAKHLLWIHGENGGEQADFSGCALRDLDITAKNFNNAIMHGTVFIECDASKMEMCFADGRGAQFVGCTLENSYMDEANFSGALFHNCDLSETVCAHGNFAHATFINCNVLRMGIWNSCIEDVAWTGTNTDNIAFDNCSYNEATWSGQGEGMDVST